MAAVPSTTGKQRRQALFATAFATRCLFFTLGFEAAYELFYVGLYRKNRVKTPQVANQNHLPWVLIIVHTFVGAQRKL